MEKRVVITGISVISPTGTIESGYWNSLLSGVSGISDLELEGFEKCYSKKFGLLDRDRLSVLADRYLSGEEKKLYICSRLSLIAAVMAAEDAGISFRNFEDKMSAGIFLGTGIGDRYKNIETPQAVDEDRFTAILDIARHFDIHGESMINGNACSAGNHAICSGAELIKNGTLDAAFVGGADVFSFLSYVIFTRLKALSGDCIRPFDKNRNGTILSEGASFLVLESLEHARKRNAHIYGEILGWGISNDAYDIVSPDPTASGISKAMRRAIENSGIHSEYVDYIAVHGTGTPSNDSAEAKAIKEVFGKHSENILASSIKSSIGHQLGAASVMSMATNVLILCNEVIPPTVNVSEPEDIPFRLVRDSAVKKRLNIIMNNAYAFGGSNSSVILKRWEDDNE